MAHCCFDEHVNVELNALIISVIGFCLNFFDASGAAIFVAIKGTRKLFEAAQRAAIWLITHKIAARWAASTIHL